MKKHCLIIILSVFLFISAPPDYAFASGGDYTVFIEADSPAAAAGSKFSAAVKIKSENQNTYTNADIIINYDRSRLRYEDASAADCLKVTEDIQGHILISIYGAPKELTEGCAEITSLTFTALTPGETEVYITDALVENSDCNTVTAVSENTCTVRIADYVLTGKSFKGSGNSQGFEFTVHTGYLPCSGSIIAASYSKEGRLLELKVLPVSVSKNSSESVLFTVSAEDGYIRAYLLDAVSARPMSLPVILQSLL